MYLELRCPLPININPGYSLRDDSEDRNQASRVAKFIISTFLWQKKLMDGNLEPEKVPQCMSQLGRRAPLSKARFHHPLLTASDGADCWVRRESPVLAGTCSTSSPTPATLSCCVTGSSTGRAPARHGFCGALLRSQSVRLTRRHCPPCRVDVLSSARDKILSQVAASPAAASGAAADRAAEPWQQP